MGSAREDIGSWLDGGPSNPAERPGQRLGLPADGPGSLARLGRRAIALGIDWALALLIAGAFFDGDPWATLGVFALENIALVGTLGTTVGHRLLGLEVTRLGSGPAGVVRALARTALICVVIPAVLWDADGRGLHDRLARTVVLRA